MTPPTSSTGSRKVMLDGPAMDRSLSRIAHEIIEQNPELSSVVLIGIQTRGVQLARRLVDKINKIAGVQLPLGVLDITMHRDDLGLLETPPEVKATHIDFDIHDKTVVLVDDVLFTGRSTRAALDALADLGRPKRIQLAVLIDRGHRQLPIRADYVGKNLPTSTREKVHVLVKDLDGKDEVLLEKPAE